MKRRTLLAAGALAPWVARAQQNATRDNPLVLKFSHVVAPETPKGRGAERFRELAEERTNGRVRVEVYPNSTLYKDKEELEALQLGAVQLLAPSVSKFGPLGVKEFEAFDLPYIFPDRAVLHRVTEGAIGASLFSRLESHGIRGLGYWDNGFKVMTANRPLRHPADFRGLKMRIQSSKVLDDQFRALGAVPQVMAFSEVYTALQTGVVDGSENTPSNVYTQRMYEVQKYLTLSNHGYIGYAVITNKSFWDGIATDLRTTLEGAMRDATRFANAVSQQDNDEALARIRESGKTQFIELSDSEKAEWHRALEVVYRDMAPRVGADLIRSIRQEAQSIGEK